MIYLHDGNFDGLLTCIYKHYYVEKVDEIYSQMSYQPQLFHDVKVMETNKEYAEKVNNAIISKLSMESYSDIFYTFFSDNYYKDCYILNYLVAGFKMGRDITKLHSHSSSYNIRRLKRQVSFERHRFLGLLRFIDIGQYLYAKFEPDNNILELLGEHFANRLKSERFIIHDVKRNKAIICNYGDWIVVDFKLEDDIKISETEEIYVKMWKGYFDAVGIETRKNIKLQQSFVPLKYRKHILEFK